MKFFIAIVLLMSADVHAQGLDHVPPTMDGAMSQTFILNPHPDLIIQCGQGSVTISTKDGHVTLNRCSPDEGARAFWDAIERVYPGAVK